MSNRTVLTALLAVVSAGSLARCADVVSTVEAPRVERGVVVRAPGDFGWMEVDSGGGSTAFISLGEATEIVWHLDQRVHLAAAELRAGTRIRFVCSVATAERIEVVSLGPLAMAVAVEEFVAEACEGRRPWCGLTAQEKAVIESLGSPSYLVREAVSRALRDRGPRALRVLVWARRHDDPEVQARAETLLHELGWERPAAAAGEPMPALR